jgi:WD40 repeat protein
MGRDRTFAAAQTLTGHASWVTCAAQLNDHRLVSGSDDKALIVWARGDDGAFAAAQTLSGHTKYVACVVLLDDGRITSGSGDQTLKVWE